MPADGGGERSVAVDHRTLQAVAGTAGRQRPDPLTNQGSADGGRGERSVRRLRREGEANAVARLGTCLVEPNEPEGRTVVAEV
jgi:hypothetical protein